MSFGEILCTLLIMPIQLFFETVYMLANRVIGHPGLSIVALSLIMNFLILPLYMRADAMQEEEKNTEMKLRKGVNHIKKTFKGDEKMMMLQTFYRQNNYKPTYVLRGATSLFLQIPFFIAAYRFLSELELLNGVSFGPIADLSKPDGILLIGGMTINVLPILMTTINLISCIIFTKGSSVKQKIQLYGMALFFLIFLYTSPAGLVFYWTLNNLFSLVKTIFYKLKNPFEGLSILFSISGIGILIGGFCFYSSLTIKIAIFFAGCGIFLQLPLIWLFIKGKVHLDKFKFAVGTPNKKMFLSGGIFLAILIGVLIPSAVIQSSPQEFVDISYFYHPLWFIVSSFCLAVGFFVIWLGVFYWLAKPSVRVLLDKGIWIASGIAIIDYMFFGKNLGILSSELKYENGLDFSMKQQFINLLVILLASGVLYLFVCYWKKQAVKILLILTIAITGMSCLNIKDIRESVSRVKSQTENREEIPTFTLSKTGKNIIVFMLDRAVGEYIPYLFNEKPELQEQFAGFTYYSNVISFGGHSNFGAPPLYGGYEYTPIEMNRRNTEPLLDKHNEALKVMPVLFDKKGYEVTVCDPTYANYEWIPDVSIFDEYTDIKTYNTEGKFTDPVITEQAIQNNKKRFFSYGILKSLPLCFQETWYAQGDYNQDNKTGGYFGQALSGLYIADGMHSNFMNPYNVLRNLVQITDVKEEKENTFLMIANNAAHEPMLLQEPDYIPAEHVDNTEYTANNQARYTVNGKTLKMENDLDITHYQVNMASLLQLGTWFDYMRENNVWDNTRIILVSDHAYELTHLEEVRLPKSDGSKVNGGEFYPLMMMKDFYSEMYEVSEEFMTNADVPVLATKGLIDNPINPFTGKEINSNEKTAHKQYCIQSNDWDVSINNGNTFLPGNWYSVHDNMHKEGNWKLVAEDSVLSEFEE